MIRVFGVSLIALVISVMAVPAQALTLRFLASGSSYIKGSFDYDQINQEYSNVNIWVPPVCANPILCDSEGASWRSLTNLAGSQIAANGSIFQGVSIFWTRAVSTLPHFASLTGSAVIRYKNSGCNCGGEYSVQAAFVSAPATVPLPASLSLAVAGLGAFGLFARRRGRSTKKAGE